MFNRNLTDKDQANELFNSYPILFLDLLIIQDQDFSGCLANCSNKGVCTVFDDDKIGCLCDVGFKGHACETNKHVCSSAPCQNNATCIEIEDLHNETSSYICKCRSNLFYGERCEKKVKVCANITCSHNGICFDNDSLPECKCWTNYNGAECEIKSYQLLVIEAVIKITVNLAICLLVAFLVLVLLIDYETHVHDNLVRIIRTRSFIQWHLVYRRN